MKRNTLSRPRGRRRCRVDGCRRPAWRYWDCHHDGVWLRLCRDHFHQALDHDPRPRTVDDLAAVVPLKPNQPPVTVR